MVQLFRSTPPTLNVNRIFQNVLDQGGTIKLYLNDKGDAYLRTEVPSKESK